MRCEEVRDLAPELALGIADGEDRAAALRHLSTCAECRRVVAEFTDVGDELLLVAPVQEPPAGFESRVVDALGFEKPAPARRLPRWLSPRRLVMRVGPAVAAAAATAVVLVSVYHDDHLTAERYRGALDRAGGRSFQAERLSDGTGSRAGVAFGYEGSPSWLLVTVDPAHRDEVQSGEIVTKAGKRIPLPTLRLDRRGSWGGAIPVALYEVASIRLLGDQPGEVLQASFPSGPDGPD